MTVNEKLDMIINGGFIAGYTYVKTLQCCGTGLGSHSATYNVGIDDIIITFTHKNNGGAASGHSEYLIVNSGAEVMLRLDDIPNSNSYASFCMMKATETAVSITQEVHYSSYFLAIQISKNPLY